MEQAGRSTRIIIEAASLGLEWVNRSYGRALALAKLKLLALWTLSGIRILLHFVLKKIHRARKRSQLLMPILHQLPRLELYTPAKNLHTAQLIENGYSLFAEDPTGRVQLC